VKVIIAGSRGITNLGEVADAIETCPFRDNITEVVSGGAAGVDTLGERWARAFHLPVQQFLAQWDDLGRGAGFARNREMAEYADALIAVWDGVSKGTSHMVDCMVALGKPIHLMVI
jgi:hypothetical protein